MKEKYEPLTEDLAGAATAITKIVAGSNAFPTYNVQTPKRQLEFPLQVKLINLSGQYLQQLTTLQQLRENTVLSEE